MTILDEIIAHKKNEVAQLKQQYPLHSPQNIRENNSLIRKIMGGEKDAFHLICEVKKASPSKGIIRNDFNPIEIAKRYERGGAAAISVLTDEKYFMGSAQYLLEIKKTVSLPILRKDFIVDAYQLYQSKLLNSDIVLLIAKVLDKKVLNDYVRLAADLKMDVLLELAVEDDLDKIKNDYDNVIFGINNRNLHDFSVDIKRSLKLRRLLPNDALVISESGIKTSKDCKTLLEAGFCGALIGETLMRSADIETELQKLKNGINV